MAPYEGSGNIGFDATAFLAPMSKGRGIAREMIGLFQTLLSANPTRKFYCLNLWEESVKDLWFSAYSNFCEVHLFSGKTQFLVRKPEYKEIFGDIVQVFLSQHQIQTFFITSPFEDAMHIYERKWFPNVHLSAMVYDVIPYIFKEQYLGSPDKMEWYQKQINLLRQCDSLLLNSLSVQEDLKQYFALSIENMPIIGTAADEKFKQIPVSDTQRETVLRKYSITSPFVLTVAGDTDRKNISGLIEGFAWMGKELCEQYQLVVACSLREASIRWYKKQAEALGVSSRIIFTNWISDEDLITLYNLTTLVAFPSLYEGFGLPVVEAWSCGAPVLTSNNSSLGEVGGDAAILVDPFDSASIGAGLKRALTETDLTVLAKKGAARAKRYNWNDTAQKALCAWDQPVPSCSDPVVRKRLACFTPLPPLRSGVADYSVDVLEKMTEYFDIDIIVDSNYTPDPIANHKIRVLCHTDYHHENYDYVLYQMGNNVDAHAYMLPYMRKCPGVVTLHDVNLHDMCRAIAFAFGKSNYQLYQKILAYDYDDEVAKRYVDDKKTGKNKLSSSDLIVNGYILDGCKKIIVHSQFGKEQLLRLNIGRDVKVVNYYVKSDRSHNDDPSIRKDLHYSKSDIVFCAFGHLNESKRVSQIMKAFEILCKEYPQAPVKLLLAGPDLSDSLKQYICNHQLTELVTNTGYLPLERLDQYVGVSDVCLNLRYPYNGENSSVLSRSLSKGKATIVNNIGSFCELPDDCCIKIPNVQGIPESIEIGWIKNAMAKLLDESVRNEIGERAYRYAEENMAIGRVVAQQAEFIRSQVCSHFNAEHITKIRKEEMEKDQYSAEEILALSKTLSYSKQLF